jgi:hypothetical protein
MVVFSAMTLFNVRSASRRLIVPSSGTNGSARPTAVALVGQPQLQQQQRAKRDTQLARLSILQVILFLILNILWAAYPLVSFVAEKFGNYIYGGDLDATITFIANFGINLVYIYASVSALRLAISAIFHWSSIRSSPSSCTHWRRVPFAKNVGSSARSALVCFVNSMERVMEKTGCRDAWSTDSDRCFLFVT